MVSGRRAPLVRRLPAFRDLCRVRQISALQARLPPWHTCLTARSRPSSGRWWTAPAIKRALVDPVWTLAAQPGYLALRVVGGPDTCVRRFAILKASSR